ncbi:hypothetical protein AAFP30_18430 [Gordonia sp. CPCC 205515]|uniref:WXG100 family type VII secretion target n=1 Tax=Gordonia sp. CPCC 205515 TaxID=3140791 RepID=UPI003AF4093C
MSNELKVDLETFRGYAKKFYNLAGRLEQATTTLTSSLESEGKCWGTDDTGQGFEEGYGPNAATALANADVHADRLTTSGDLVESTADGFATTETTTTNIFGGR